MSLALPSISIGESDLTFYMNRLSQALSSRYIGESDLTFNINR